MRLRLMPFAIVFAVFLVFLHYRSIDGIGGVLLRATFIDTTSYAPGYTDRGFRAVRPGMTEAQVRKLIGPPLGERWSFVARDKLGTFDPANPCKFVNIRADRVEEYVNPNCRERGIEPFMLVGNVEKILGSPLV